MPVIVSLFLNDRLGKNGYAVDLEFGLSNRCTDVLLKRFYRPQATSREDLDLTHEIFVRLQYIKSTGATVSAGFRCCEQMAREEEFLVDR